ncbi:hypothetical protein CVT25_004175 [Psilocybe cyanescens]|uniref:DUF6534 domain-containing protein n=1 Tax=Psilocybe cyanescens TaxID=93625 RepID=A0A409X330_PSICY|nr:hypothetical protein CVT25_004175 [Psilocybe cyanescens]
MATGSVDNTLGAAFIGFGVSCVVFGVLTTQIFVFYRRFPMDRMAYKLLVSKSSSMSLEMVDQIFIAYSLYFYMVTKRRLLQIVMSAVASLALGAGLLTDFLIAVALCFCLQRMRTGARKADTLVNTLSLYAVNTGALTGAISLLTIILYNVRPDTFYFMASYFTLGKRVYLNILKYQAHKTDIKIVYAICFLCALNTRKVLRGKGTDQEGNTSNTSNMQNTFFMVTNSGRLPRPLEYSTSQTKVGIWCVIAGSFLIAIKQSVEIDIHQEVSVITDIENMRQDNSFILGASEK